MARKQSPLRPVLLFLGIVVVVSLSGCARMYFRDAGTPPVAPQYVLDEWPYREYWQGVVFNGSKIGFSHLSLASLDRDTGLYEIRSEAVILFRFLGLEKRLNIKAVDYVNADLTLSRFDYDYLLDGHDLKLTGAVRSKELSVALTTGGQTQTVSYALAEKLYPTSAMTLFPVFRGLAVGRHYRYLVYDGQTQTLAHVTQEIQAYEASDLFAGNAYRVNTSLHGHRSDTWIDTQGRPMLEMALGGVLISGYEEEHTAKRFLASASLNKRDLMLDYSLVRISTPIQNPRQLTSMRIALDGLNQSVPREAWQQCEPRSDIVVCDVRTPVLPPPGGLADETQFERYLRPSVTVPTYDSRIQNQARLIIGDARRRADQIQRILAWLDANIEKEPVDVFSALDVLQDKKAECQGHAYLFTAFARSLGIPTRVVNGLVYSSEAQGFLYHSWAESRLGGAWYPIDPTFGQLGADATHLKLIEGEKPGDLLPLVDVVGKLKARIIEANPDHAQP